MCVKYNTCMITSHFHWPIYIALSMLGLMSTIDIGACPVNEDRSVFELFSQEDVLHISIETDIHRFLETKDAEEEQKALIKIEGEPDFPSKWVVDLSARGKHRKMTCGFPPVKLKFKKSTLKTYNLKAFRTLKLVTHCGDKAEAQELLLKEYLTYKIYNLLTPHSFRVQLLKIDWQDSGEKYNIGEKWGFIIEHKDELAHRLECSEHDNPGVFHHELNTSNASINYMFQYLIGNHDWDLATGRNIKFIQHPPNDELLAVPYDFDFSLLVNAYYLSIDWKLTGPNKRVYLGNFSDVENQATLEFFKSKKSKILKLIKSCKHLSRDTRFEMRRYIKSYYSSLGKPLIRVSDVQ